MAHRPGVDEPHRFRSDRPAVRHRHRRSTSSRLPWWRFLVDTAMVIVILSGLVAAAIHYLYGGISPSTPGERTTRAARVQLSILIGLFVLLKAAAYWLDRYELVITPNSLFTGAGYTDVNALIPAKTILTFVALICAASVLREHLPGDVASRGAEPGVADPQCGRDRMDLPEHRSAAAGEADRERQGSAVHRAKHPGHPRTPIASTAVEVEDYDPAEDPDAKAFGESRGTLENVRLMDPSQADRHLRPAAAGEGVLHVPGSARHRSLHDRRQAGGRHRLAPRDRPRRASQPSNATGSTTTSPTPTASDSLLPTATGRLSMESPTSPSSTCHPRACSTSSSRASTSARRLPTTRSSAHPRRVSRASSTSPTTLLRTDSGPTRTPARAACRWGRSSTGSCTRGSSRRPTSCFPTASMPTRRSCTCVIPASA